MIYSENTRLNYAVTPIIETKNFIVINQHIYDKKTLALLSNVNLEAGWRGYTRYNKLLAMSRVAGVDITNFHQDTSFLGHLYGGIFKNNISGTVSSVIDSSDQNIEWTISGESLIKFNIRDKTFERTTISSVYFPSICIIHQDEDYLYGLGVNHPHGTYASGNSTFLNSRNVVRFSINKTTKAYLAGTNVDSGVNGPFRLHVLGTEGNIVYIYMCVQGTTKVYAITCANGSQSWPAVTGIPANWSNTSSKPYLMPSSPDKYGWMYSLNTANGLCAFKFVGGAIDSLQTEVLNTSAKIDHTAMADILDMEELDAATRNKYFQPQYAYEGKSQHYSSTYNFFYHDCMLMGKDEEYLVHIQQNWHGLANNYGANKYMRHMAVYKRNDPENDPLDLTLTDYYDLSMQTLKAGYH